METNTKNEVTAPVRNTWVSIAVRSRQGTIHSSQRLMTKEEAETWVKTAVGRYSNTVNCSQRIAGTIVKASLDIAEVRKVVTCERCRPELTREVK